MRVVVMGLGNVLASDDAVGIEVARALADLDLPAGVRVLEGATAGLGLIELLLGADTALLVDAVAGGTPPGTLHRIEEGDLPRQATRALSAHDLALPEALALGHLLYPDQMPRRMVLFGVEVERLDPYRRGLSPAVRAAVPAAVAAILEELRA